MRQSLVNPDSFIITYDDGESEQVLTVPHNLYNSDKDFQKNIISMKCLSCNYSSNFDVIEKENTS